MNKFEANYIHKASEYLTKKRAMLKKETQKEEKKSSIVQKVLSLFKKLKLLSKN